MGVIIVWIELHVHVAAWMAFLCLPTTLTCMHCNSVSFGKSSSPLSNDAWGDVDLGYATFVGLQDNGPIHTDAGTPGTLHNWASVGVHTSAWYIAPCTNCTRCARLIVELDAIRKDLRRSWYIQCTLILLPHMLLACLSTSLRTLIIAVTCPLSRQLCVLYQRDIPSSVRSSRVRVCCHL
jgi:hypothetical protein